MKPRRSPYSHSSGSSARQRCPSYICAPADQMALTIDAVIKHQGGIGNISQITLLLAKPLSTQQCQQLRDCWISLAQSIPILGARLQHCLRGRYWRCESHALPLEISPCRVTEVAEKRLYNGIGDHQVQLALSQHQEHAGLIITWQHAIMDARSALWILRHLPAWSQGAAIPTGRPEERWLELRTWKERISCFRYMKPLLDHIAADSVILLPERQTKRCAGVGVQVHKNISVQPSVGARRAHIRLTRQETVVMKERQKQASGRFSTAAFLQAAWAAVLLNHGALDGIDKKTSTARNSGTNKKTQAVLFPLAVSMRTAEKKPQRQTDEIGVQGGGAFVVGNMLGILQLALPITTVAQSLTDVAQAFRSKHRAAIRMGAIETMLGILSFLTWMPQRVIRYLVGNGGAGMYCSSFLSDVGADDVGTSWWEAPIQDIQHATAVPCAPGIALLVHSHDECFCADMVASRDGVYAMDYCLEVLSAELRWQLLERPITEVLDQSQKDADHAPH